MTEIRQRSILLSALAASCTQEFGAGAVAVIILFLERKSIKKNFNLALQCLANPEFPHGNEAVVRHITTAGFIS